MGTTEMSNQQFWLIIAASAWVISQCGPTAFTRGLAALWALIFVAFAFFNVAS
jgi:hypothetical protein